jgi:hypothetical protein
MNEQIDISPRPQSAGLYRNKAHAKKIDTIGSPP